MKQFKPYIVYILGPMRGRKLYNFPAFDAMQATLLLHGHSVWNPAGLDREEGFDPERLPADHDWNVIPESMKLDDVIARDLRAIQKANAYVCLDGWQKSVGATAEKAVLDWRGAQRLDPVTLTPIPSNWEPVEASPEKATPQATPQVAGGEVCITDPKTGGQKGQKLQRYDLVPGEPLKELAEVYGRGASKYSDDNWRKGYSWKLSFGALNRHLWAWWMGEQRDELGNHHLASVAWHCFTLMWYELRGKGTDDRPLPSAS